MSYEPYIYIPSKRPVRGKWSIIAAELSSGMAVDVGSLYEAKCLQRACQKRRLKASICAPKDAVPKVIVW